MNSFDQGLFRGPHQDAGFFDIQAITATLDLESGAQVWGDSSPLDEALAGEIHNIKVYPHPLGGILPPTLEELRAASGFLRVQKGRGVRTYVHCHHGVDRTGMVVAAYRIMQQNWKPLDAAMECFREGMHWCYWPWLVQLWRL